MIKQIRLQNFMSHKDTVLNLTEGLTVLAGPNNCGKSAVVEALRAVCENMTAHYMIRHGETEARVSLVTSDGHTITWIRTKTSAAYDINGVRYDRLQGKVPDDLHKILKMPPVPVERDETLDVHIAHQKNPIFLLGGTGSRPAAFFASSSDAGRLIQMQELHRKRKQERRRDKRRLDEDIADLDATLEALKPLRSIQEQWALAGVLNQEIESESSQAETLVITIANLAQAENAKITYECHIEPLNVLEPPPKLYNPVSLVGLIQQIKAVDAHLNNCRKQALGLSRLPKPPTLHDTLTLGHRIARLSLGTTTLTLRQRACLALSDLVELPELGDVDMLENAISNLGAASTSVERLHDQAIRLHKLQEPPHLFDSIKLQHLLWLLSDALEKHSACNRVLELLDGLPPTPVLTETAGLYRTATDIVKTQSVAQDAIRALHDVNTELSSVKNLIEAWVLENPTCPTCGALVTTDSLLEEHSHV